MPMTEAPFSLTVKTPRGNLFTIRGETAAELKANLNSAPEQGVLALISQIEATLAGQPKASAVAPRATATTQVNTSVTSGSHSTQELPSGFGTPKCVECDEPTRFDREGVSQKSGKAYKRFLCTGNPTHKATFTS